MNDTLAVKIPLELEDDAFIDLIVALEFALRHYQELGTQGSTLFQQREVTTGALIDNLLVQRAAHLKATIETS
jgi:hypothetical protein